MSSALFWCRRIFVRGAEWRGLDWIALGVLASHRHVRGGVPRVRGVVDAAVVGMDEEEGRRGLWISCSSAGVLSVECGMRWDDYSTVP